MGTSTTAPATITGDSLQRSTGRQFYLWMAGVFVLIAFGDIARVMLTLFAPPGRMDRRRCSFRCRQA